MQELALETDRQTDRERETVYGRRVREGGREGKRERESERERWVGDGSELGIRTREQRCQQGQAGLTERQTF